jgi:hypothetical protein
MAIERIETYDDPVAESRLFMGISGEQPALISTTAEVEVQLKNGFDNQRQKAKNFGRVKFLGMDLARISVEFVVLPGEEQAFYNTVVPLVRQRGKKGNAPPLDVINLQMNRIGIDVVTVLTCKIGPPNPRSGRRVQIELQEWAPAPTAPKAVKAATAAFNPKVVEANVLKSITKNQP